MGVRGLTTYVNLNQDAFLQYYLLHDTALVIDGNSMCAQLYRSLNCFSAFGGDYDKYAIYVKNFLKGFRKCNITPYVIFDGSHESRKLKTVHNRLRSKIRGASRLDPVTQGSLQIFPLLIRCVFKQVLDEMNVPYTTCEFEADDEIATMARHLNCPVLSYDSDFFIYNVLYIPFNTLERKPKPFDVDGKRVNAYQCKLYRVEFLIENFGGLKKELLPLLATLLGNDYVEKRVFNKFFAQLKLPKSKKCKNDQQRCIHGIFKWLQNETLDSAIAKILGRVKKTGKQKVLNIIKKSIDGYNRTYCRSLKYFNICEEKPIGEEFLFQFSENIETEDSGDGTEDNASTSGDESTGEESDEESDCKIEDELVLGLPEWFADGVRKNLIPKTHINLYTHHSFFCNPQAEDYKDEDSCLCALPIMRYIFDILTDFEHDNCIYVSRESDSNYRRILVGREYSVPRIIEVPFKDLSVEQLSLYFNSFLKEKLPSLDLTDIHLLPPNIQLYMISMLWWVSKCNVPLAHIHSLLLTYIMLEVIDERTGTFRGHNQFTRNYSKKIEDLKKDVGQPNYEEPFLNKCKVQYEDCLIAANVLLKHFEIDDSILKRPKTYDVKKMHSFAQFQCCLLHFNALNILCRKPYESTLYHKCFNGTFVYNIALKLENQVDPMSFLEQYLRGATTVLMFYRSLCNIYQKCEEKMSLTTAKWTGKKRKRKKNKNKEEDDVMEALNSFVTKGFGSMVIL